MSFEHLHYVVVEGPIGVGKTTLAAKLANSIGAKFLSEGQDENPFLGRFYEDPRGNALSTQLFFLVQRAKQMQSLRQGDLFAPTCVSDFMIEKDRLFAIMNLDEDEMHLYEQIYAHLTLDAPTPDLVIYLQAPVNTLESRVMRRGRVYEQRMESGYLSTVSDVYARFFYNYDASPLLIVNTEDINLADNDDDYEHLLEYLSKVRAGRHYFNPLSK